jgi:hypothetical protein
VERLNAFGGVRKNPFEGLVLMCKNRIVFHLDREEVLCTDLLPGLMRNSPYVQTFSIWMEKRYAAKSNTFARQIRGHVFGQGNRRAINTLTHALSLSDCYWVKQENESVDFEDISPYFKDFWTGAGHYEGQAAPTLYVNGYLPKYWLDKNVLVKAKDKKEVYCANLAREMQIPCVKVYPYEDKIAVENFTNEHLMFEAAEASGTIHPEEFTTEDVLKVLGQFGYDMLFFDAIIGNGDRHAGNFGFIRGTDTGEYLSPAPLFDFDHAFDSESVDDILIGEVKEYRSWYPDRHNELVLKATELELTDYVRERLEEIK